MSDTPTTGHSANFRGAEPDGRLFNQTYERNIKPVTDGLLSFASDLDGYALEIGSGTGMHICSLSKSLPAMKWIPSEPDEIHRTSIDAWRVETKAPALPAVHIDAAADWPQSVALTGRVPLSLILSMNVIHIAPLAVCEGIVSGAGRTLAKGGFLAFYGPFQENGSHTGEGNRVFDERLKADNPEWGVRDTSMVSEIAALHGLEFFDLLTMPANNRLLVFQKA